MDKSKLKSLGVNIIAPGIGQFFLKRFFRGVFMLFASLALCLWALIIIFSPIISYMSDSSQNPQQLPVINFINLVIALVSVVLIWGWSYLDILLFKEKPTTKI